MIEDPRLSFANIRPRPLSDFLDAFVELSGSPAAPTPPWGASLPASNVAAAAGDGDTTLAGGAATGPRAGRRPRVLFDDAAAEPGAAPGPGPSASQRRAAEEVAQRAAAVKRLRELLGNLHVDAQTELADGAAVAGYFAAKSLVEALPAACLIPLSDPGTTASRAFAPHRFEQPSSAAPPTLSAKARRLQALRRSEAHHFGTRHAFQLFLRTLHARSLAAQPPAQQQPQQQQQRARKGAAQHAAAAAGPPPSALVLTPETLPLACVAAAPPARSREDVLASVEARTGLPAVCVELLHLQQHGHHRDRKLLRGAVGGSDGAEERGGSLARQPSMGQLSSASGSQFNLASSNSASNDDDDHRSVGSGGPAAVARRLSTRLAGLAPAVGESADFWISLKGIVFRIMCSGEVPAASTSLAGRRLFYRTTLLPVFSGRECTAAFAVAGVVDPLDFASPAERAREMARRAEAASADRGVAARGDFTAEQRDHINRVFELFLHDFEVVGFLEHCEHLWF